jgi:acetyl esterase
MTLDPVLAELLKHLPPPISGPPDWPALRADAKTMLPLIAGGCPPIELASIENLELPGLGGDVPVRIYRPLAPTSTTLIHIHGGGMVAGDLDSVDHTVRYFADRLPAVVVSCTYRLAPENKFPAGFEDALAATKWALAHVTELGGDSDHVLIAGDSAGGNLVAAVTLALREERRSGSTGGALRSLRAQLLLYPWLDLRGTAEAFPSRIADQDPSLTISAISAIASAYLNPGDADDLRASPSAAADLSDLPATLVVVLTVDPLRDEGVDYARRLSEAGVETEVVEFDNLTHGFIHLRCLVPAAAEAFDHVLVRFKEMLGRSRTFGNVAKSAAG